MKQSLLSMSVTSMLSPSDSDNKVLNSRPPKPAPSTTIRAFMDVTDGYRSI